jgi:hypothetical protein
MIVVNTIKLKKWVRHMRNLIKLFLISISLTVWANDVTQGDAAYEKKDYTNAAIHYAAAAEQGSARGQLMLGFMYEVGRGVNQDYAEAMRLYRMAAEQGNETAYFNIANMFEEGRGVTQNHAEALRWHKMAMTQGLNFSPSGFAPVPQPPTNLPKAQLPENKQEYDDIIQSTKKLAAQGDARAQFHLGEMYKEGEVIAKDYAEAVRWYKMAAGQGHALAQYNLGEMYRLGNGTEKNLTEAVHWLRLAAEQGVSRSLNSLFRSFLEQTEITIEEVRRRLIEEPNQAQQLHSWLEILEEERELLRIWIEMPDSLPPRI